MSVIPIKRGEASLAVAGAIFRLGPRHSLSLALQIALQALSRESARESRESTDLV